MCIRDPALQPLQFMPISRFPAYLAWVFTGPLPVPRDSVPLDPWSLGLSQITTRFLLCCGPAMKITWKQQLAIGNSPHLDLMSESFGASATLD